MAKKSDIALRLTPFFIFQAPKIYVPFCYVHFGPYERYTLLQ